MTNYTTSLARIAALTQVAPRAVERPLRPRRNRLRLWLFGLGTALLLYGGIEGFFRWPHVISSQGGRYFVHRLLLPVPIFSQNDPRWAREIFDGQGDTLGGQGCAITSAAMVLASYGVPTDPQLLTRFLLGHQGFTPEGWLYWERAALAAPPGQIASTYEDRPSYDLIDRNLLAGNPVIVRLTLPSGTTHFVVLVGKDGWDYLAQDPARSAQIGIYPLHDLTPRIEGLRFYQLTR